MNFLPTHMQFYTRWYMDQLFHTYTIMCFVAHVFCVPVHFFHTYDFPSGIYTNTTAKGVTNTIKRLQRCVRVLVEKVLECAMYNFYIIVLLQVLYVLHVRVYTHLIY